MVRENHCFYLQNPHSGNIIKERGCGRWKEERTGSVQKRFFWSQNGSIKGGTTITVVSNPDNEG